MAYPARLAPAPSASTRDGDAALMDMELIEHHRRRLGALTGRMTTILNGFDRRLIKLESSILPIHQSTRMLARISASTSPPNAQMSERHRKSSRQACTTTAWSSTTSR